MGYLLIPSRLRGLNSGIGILEASIRVNSKHILTGLDKPLVGLHDKRLGVFPGGNILVGIVGILGTPLLGAHGLLGGVVGEVRRLSQRHLVVLS